MYVLSAGKNRERAQNSTLKLYKKIFHYFFFFNFQFIYFFFLSFFLFCSGFFFVQTDSSVGTRLKHEIPCSNLSACSTV